MSVDLNDLIPSLQRELSPPGSNLYPNATDDDWLGHLQDAFWEARIQGLLSGFTLDDQDDALIVPQSGTTDMTRDLQQLIVLFAGYRVTLTQFQNINSGFRAKAGADVESGARRHQRTARAHRVDAAGVRFPRPADRGVRGVSGTDVRHCCRLPVVDPVT
jgi:hypothetical protein